jgi:hypothetical protein
MILIDASVLVDYFRALKQADKQVKRGARKRHAPVEKMENAADVKAAKKARKQEGGITLEQYRKKHGL